MTIDQFYLPDEIQDRVGVTFTKLLRKTYPFLMTVVTASAKFLVGPGPT